MKELMQMEFDPAHCRKEIDEFGDLLASNEELSEHDDVLPFLRDRQQLSAFLGACISDIGPANRLAYEFKVFGDFAADLVIGNFERKTYCAVEFEDARPGSIFRKQRRKATKEWGQRLEHGFSQLVDWFFSFDDHKNSQGYFRHFGYGHINFFGMLVIGRSKHLSEHDITRLRWRSDRVTINTHAVSCRTFDDLYDSLNSDWRLLSSAAKYE